MQKWLKMLEMLENHFLQNCEFSKISPSFKFFFSSFSFQVLS